MRVLWLCFSVLLLSACASKKGAPVAQKSCGRESFTRDELNQLSEEQAQRWYKIKGDAYVEFKEEKFEMDVQIRMKMGELIWISISKASFPVAKILFKNDSAFLVDMIHQQYMATDYQALEQRAGMSLSFETLQGIFLGQSLNFKDSVFQWVNGSSVVMADQPQGDPSITSQLSSKEELVRAQWVNCASAEIEKQLFRLPKKQDELWVKYANYQIAELINYPGLISIRASREKQQQLLCNFEIKSIKTADEMNIPFEIPSDYEEMQ